ncbi:glycosyltransferase family 2 protein [Curtobacterium sp. SP.BCo]|uniref:glycosyltransferase family 2 protein n=1 Tax=Curtobacterium sp. SP.BCo TaxID=3435229 RepID=UPI003F734718
MKTVENPTVSSLVSVVVPLRDSAPWVGELLESVLAQGLTDIEVVVVDNGSVDASADVVSSFADRDGRIRLIGSDAGSAAAARNEGVVSARGEYLVFADADDIVPDGAYRAMVESLATSGSDMVIGDHLKFSPSTTWSPTARWSAFDRARTSIIPEDLPGLLAGRACWNRMFRRSFWDRADLRFPEIASVEDIEPMTRALVSAERIDVVPVPVYLYRDRSDSSSISKRTDRAATVRYFEQEFICSELLDGRPALQETHAEVVLDADGWAHLARFFAVEHSVADVAAVRAALEELLRVVPLERIEETAPVRRMLWALVLGDEHAVLPGFVRGSTSSHGRDRIDAWVAGLAALRRADTSRVDIGRLVEEGFLPILVNGADEVAPDRLADVVRTFDDLPLGPSEPGLLAAMADAVGRGDAGAVRAVSNLRHLVPLVVSGAEPSARGLELSGAVGSSPLDANLKLVLRSDEASDTIVVPLRMSSGRWVASLDATQFAAGRWTVSVAVEGVFGDFPVVTARMPLPPLDTGFPMQPLADRRNGWRFLIDRRAAPRRGITGILARVNRKLR